MMCEKRKYRHHLLLLLGLYYLSFSRAHFNEAHNNGKMKLRYQGGDMKLHYGAEEYVFGASSRSFEKKIGRSISPNVFQRQKEVWNIIDTMDSFKYNRLYSFR